MNDFNRKVEEASARVSQTIAEAAERIEKEAPNLSSISTRGCPRRARAIHQGAAHGRRQAA